MCLRMSERGECAHSAPRMNVILSGYGKCDKHLIGMKPRIMVTEILGLKPLYGSKYFGGYDIYILIDACLCLKRVKKCGSRCTVHPMGLNLVTPNCKENCETWLSIEKICARPATMQGSFY